MGHIELREPGDTDRSVHVHVITDDGCFAGTAASYPVGDRREVSVSPAPHAGGSVAISALRLLVAREPERPLFARAVAEDAAAVGVLREAGFTEVPPDTAPDTAAGILLFALLPVLDGA